ncbi:MAG TPA: hypothetical protein PKC10_00760 [Cyclobacteriaceae bacterium]|nr:hypothetical protein [Cyclobacteriaceae bacterium]
MKTKSAMLKSLLLVLGLMFGWTAWAQQSSLQYWRPYDKRGINVFETSKEDTVIYDGLKVRLGAGFTQGYQNLKHSNGLATPALYEMGGGFPLAQANFNIDVQLYDGISLNLVSYMASHHHNEFWVKGGYLQIDKVGFLKIELFDNLWKNLTLKVGHMEVNYGDAHFRRSDGGHTLWNPWVENNIMDAFTTEIGAELYWKKDGIILMGGFTDGEIQGNIANPSTPDGAKRKPNLYAKVGYDKQVNDNLRVRLTASAVTTKSSASNTLFGGDRTGSNYQYVMENAPVTLTGNAFSGRFNPGFRDNLTSVVVNPFVKFNGLEVFGTFEWAKGNSAFENGEGTTYAAQDDRKAQQTAIEALYRFGKEEQFYVGARYITVNATMAEGYTAAAAGTRYDVEIDRTSIGAGWFITRNILLKGEYVTQNYDGFRNTGPNNRFFDGKFDGFVIQGAISF